MGDLAKRGLKYITIELGGVPIYIRGICPVSPSVAMYETRFAPAWARLAVEFTIHVHQIFLKQPNLINPFPPDSLQHARRSDKLFRRSGGQYTLVVSDPCHPTVPDVDV